MAIRIIGFLCAAYALFWLAGALRRSGPKVRRVIWWLVGAAGLGVLVVVLGRFGLHWLGVAGATAWALGRRALPWLIRGFPVARRMWGQRSAGQSRHGAESSGKRGRGRPGSAGGMPRNEALAVLGLDAAASEQDILRAYKELMTKVHPDKPGGSTYLASKLNEARDSLLS